MEDESFYHSFPFYYSFPFSRFGVRLMCNLCLQSKSSRRPKNWILNEKCETKLFRISEYDPFSSDYYARIDYLVAHKNKRCTQIIAAIVLLQLLCCSVYVHSQTGIELPLFCLFAYFINSLRINNYSINFTWIIKLIVDYARCIYTCYLPM